MTSLSTRVFRPVAIGAALALVAATTSGLTPAAAPAAAQTAPAPPPIQSVLLSPLSSHDLAAPGQDGQVKRRGQNNDVAVLGRTAFVAAGAAFHGVQSTPGRTCTDHGGVKVMDLTDPVRPVMVSTITMEDTLGAQDRGGVKFNNVSVTASSVDARSVRTPTFNGDVVAIATQRCERSFFTGARIEFWDVTNRSTPTRIGVFDPKDIVFGTNPNGTPRTGAWGIFEDVRMFTRGSRLMAVATTPFSIGNAHDASPFGDFRLLDITDLRNPQQVGTFPPVSIGQDSINGCRTFQGGRSVAPTPDGNGAILSWYDGSAEFTDDRTAAVFKLDLDNLPRHTLGATPQFNPNPPSWGYPYNADVEGNAADVQPFVGANGELRVMLSEDDIDPALTRVGIGPLGATPQQYRGCTMMLGKHLYEYPGQQLASEIVYVGRACPASTRPGTTNTVPEELLADPAGKIAVIEGGGNLFDGCSAMDKLNRLTAAGAVAVLTSGGGDVLNATTSAPPGGIASIPYLTVTQAAYNNVQLIPSNVLGSAAFPVPSTSPPIWERTSTTNVTGASFPGRADKGRFKSVADATDRAARVQLAPAGRSPVTAGQQYQASVFLSVESITGGAFRSAVVWYDAGGAAVSEAEITSLDAVTSRSRFERSVTVPAGAVSVGIKAEWSGGDAAAGTAYADTFALVRPGLQGTLKDNRGEWGAQRVLDFSRATPTEIGTYRSPKSLLWPPPDAGLYAPRLARMFGRDLAFTTWLSDGLRVLDVSGGQPREVASFVPPATTDPMPQAGAGGGLLRGESWGTKTLVAGIDIIPTSDSSGIAVVSDINAGLYMQAFQIQRVGEVAPGGTANAGPGEQIRLVGTGFAPGAPVRLTLGDGRDIGAVTADGSGSFSTRLTLPLDIRPGSHGIQAAGAAAGGGTKVLRYTLVIPSMGYWTVASDGGVFAFGRAGFFGSTGAIRLNQPMVAMASTPTALGYWLAAADGGVFSFGDAAFRGSTGGIRLNRPIVGMAPTRSGRGYWLVASDGGVFAFGDAPFLGSTGGIRLNSPVVGMAPTESGKGYWLVAADGGVFSFGDAGFKGSTGNIRLNRPVTGMATTPSGNGYWLVATDGGIFSFGDARFFGSTGGIRLNQPVTGMASTPSGGGYWLVATDGGIFSFGNAEFSGSTGGIRLTKPMVGMARFPRV